MNMSNQDIYSNITNENSNTILYFKPTIPNIKLLEIDKNEKRPIKL